MRLAQHAFAARQRILNVLTRRLLSHCCRSLSPWRARRWVSSRVYRRAPSKAEHWTHVPRRTATAPSRSAQTLIASRWQLYTHLESIRTWTGWDAELLGRFYNDLPLWQWYTRTWIASICQSNGEQVLDPAVRVLATSYGSDGLKNHLLAALSCYKYDSSLNSLRTLVAHPQQSRTSALQNRVLVLATFEFYNKCLFKDSTQLTVQGLVEGGDADSQLDPIAWVHHARGIGRVIHRQGPVDTGSNNTDMSRFIYLCATDTLVRDILLFRQDQQLSITDRSCRHTKISHRTSLTRQNGKV